ncbi:hypothetical protein BDQ12DRAFT_764937 [Crucibulum laeve]|uniref:G-protein coupled receptors family 1 profile domain-containing protein n=1 Tax=Crucibulum laeve TaxID=68775 RepID=A0A5C3M9H3_9AGAR|nr:hypothetical protein BDQ12DRAFT_764937 [Crucibulum laeve]
MASQNDSVADPRLLLPNPFTPLAFVPPEDAYTIAIAAYVLIGTLTICMWDGLHSLSQDYLLLFKNKIGIPTITYFLSRICTFGFALTASIFETGPIKHCATFRTVTNIFYLLSVPMTSFLFFLRVRAVYNRNKYVSAVFFTLWLAVLGYSLSLVTAIKGTNIGPTDYCTDTPLEARDGGTGISIFIHDTLVFLAISWRLFSISHVDNNTRKGLKVVLFGHYLPAFSKAILHDGQVYYLMSLATVLISLALFFSTHLPTQMRTVFSAFTITITNIMACRVFRNVKLGLYRKQGGSFQSLNTTALNSFNRSRTVGRSAVTVPLPLGHVKTMDYHTDISHTDVQTTDLDDSKPSGRNNSFV